MQVLNEAYGEATALPFYPTITRRMRGYYAFNSRRYHHALHPMTVGVIIETGFLTSARDRRVIIGEPDRAARYRTRAADYRAARAQAFEDWAEIAGARLAA
mgnify:CR=1 FL=1